MNFAILKVIGLKYINDIKSSRGAYAARVWPPFAHFRAYTGQPFDVITTDISAVDSSLMRGRVVLEASVLKQLRHSRQLSQEELANECSLRHFRVSISSIKRAETSKPVLFRIARELARFFNVPAERLICGSSSRVRSGEDSGGLVTT
jgi:DNA-binding XRE family transcriptional regulator